jgi:hypothetical protein
VEDKYKTHKSGNTCQSIRFNGLISFFPRRESGEPRARRARIEQNLAITAWVHAASSNAACADMKT